MMNKKMSSFAVAGIVAMGVLSLGAVASADYKLVCDEDPTITWNEYSRIGKGGGEGCTTASERRGFAILKHKDAWKIEDYGIVPISDNYGDSSPFISAFSLVDGVSFSKRVLSEDEDFAGCRTDLHNIVIDGQKVVYDGEEDEYVYNADNSTLYRDKMIKEVFTCKGEDEELCKKDFNNSYGSQYLKDLGTSFEADSSEASNVYVWPYLAKGGYFACHLEKDGKRLGASSSPVAQPKVEVPAVQPEEKTNVNVSMNTSSMLEKDFSALKQQPLFVVLKHFGYENKKSVKKVLAENFGIKNYVGTRLQNIDLKISYLVKFLLKS